MNLLENGIYFFLRLKYDVMFRISYNFFFNFLFKMVKIVLFINDSCLLCETNCYFKPMHYMILNHFNTKSMECLLVIPYKILSDM